MDTFTIFYLSTTGASLLVFTILYLYNRLNNWKRKKLFDMQASLKPIELVKEIPVYVDRAVEVVKEVPIYVDHEVEKVREIVKEVPIYVNRIVEVEKEVIIEVPVYLSKEERDEKRRKQAEADKSMKLKYLGDVDDKTWRKFLQFSEKKIP